ncbi:MAG: von Willebrand factor type A domain-containing protein [Deltaproteobacteria bacterium]|nr:von Willebrand factor type A domain-containing protein [Deltaproteobacteria bacterium]
MSALRDKDLAKRLRGTPVPEPPEELLRQIQAEIPEDLFPPHRGAEAASRAPFWRSWGQGQMRLVAAALVMVVGGGFLAHRVSWEAPPWASTSKSPTSQEPAAEMKAQSRDMKRDSGSVAGLEDDSRNLAELVALDEDQGGSGAVGGATFEEGAEKRALERPGKALGKERTGDLQSEADIASSVEPVEREALESLGYLVGGAEEISAPQESAQALPVPQYQDVGGALGAKAKEMRQQSAPPPPTVSAERTARLERGLQRENKKLRTLIPDPTPDDPEAVVPSAENQRSGGRAEQNSAGDSPQDLVFDEISITAPAPVVDVTSAVVGQEITLEPKRRRKKKKERKALSPPSSRPSSGGLIEPNDQPYSDNFFQSYGTNPFIDTEDDHLSTFGLDVDTGSYSVVRRHLRDGHLPPQAAIRVEEMVNYFDYGDAPPEDGDFALKVEGAPSPFAQGPRYRLLRFNIHGREVQTSQRPPAVLIFVVDTSGSMSEENRLGLVKSSLNLLLDQLSSTDRVGLVEFGERGRVVLEPTGDQGRIRAAIQSLQPGSSTNAEEGLVLGYSMAARNFRRQGINRVILCSDGVANVGRTGPDSILERVREEAERGIELTTLGFGMGNYNDVLMERLADRGNGRYAYLDSLDEAYRVLVEDLTGTLQTIAAEARVQVDFNPEVVERYRLLGYENRDIADQKFRDDRVDAGEIGAGHSVTALYEIKLAKDVSPRAHLATIHLRYASRVSAKIEEVSHPVTHRAISNSWKKASPALRLSALVAEFAEILKGSYWARGSELQQVFQRAQRLSPSFEGDTKVVEFVDLVGKASRLEEQRQR